MARDPGIYGFNAPRNSARPNLTVLLISPGLLLMLRALTDVQILDWQPLMWWVVLVTICLLGTILWALPAVREKPGPLTTVPAAMAEAIVSASIVSMAPVSSVGIVIRRVVHRCIGQRLDDRAAGKANPHTDVGVRIGGQTLSHACHSERGAHRNGCNS